MPNYNFFEKKIAKILSSNPKLKLKIKKTYQKINSILFKKSYKLKVKNSLKIIKNSNEESFFGYYDKSPINLRNSHVVFLSSKNSTKNKPSPQKEIEIYLLDVESDMSTFIDKVTSYNWQQGCKLMWISNDEFIYNTFNSEKKDYESKIYNIKKKEFKIIKKPIYDATLSFGIGLNFQRLNIERGDYSYFNLANDVNWSDNHNDGVFFINLKENTSKLIISLESIINLNYKESMNNARHKFNHIMISPMKDKFMFMHRWFTPNGQRFDTLYVSSINGDNIKKIADDEMVSHCCWKDNNTIIAYLRDSILGDKFYEINLIENKKEVLAKGYLDTFGDGHPSYFDGNILFDTYPNKSRMKELYIYNEKNHNLNKIGEFYESLAFYGETRCDLHPRFSCDGKRVFIDSVHEGKRQLYMMNIK